MAKIVTTFILALFSLCSVGQKSSLKLEKLILKNLRSQISYIPPKLFTSPNYTGSDSVSFYGKRIDTVHGFYISKTEVTNREYREFVYYARDSIAHTMLSDFRSGTHNIDWGKSIDWKSDLLDAMMLSPGDRIFGRKEIDPAQIVYVVDFFGKKEVISIYPDTLVWLRDFSYADNELLVQNYFSQSSFDPYPVVGINLKQAMAFCEWKKGRLHLPKKGKGGEKVGAIVRLPSSTEWESAAFKSKDTVDIFNGNKGYSCNFGNITAATGIFRKGFKDDGYFFTAPVRSFPVGPFGLYDMKGNVAEWTSTTREELTKAEMRPGKLNTFFAVKGGGWNSPPFYLQAGVCQFFPADEAHSFIGFRYVVQVTRK